MSEDHTVPMQPPQWSRRETNLDDQETIFADQEAPTPPTLPLGDHGGVPTPRTPGPVAPERSVGAPPPPFTPPQAPVRPPGSPAPAGADAQTMMISERPAPVFAWLVVVDGPDRGSIGSIHELHPDDTTIGRVHGNKIVLRDETVSAQHARIRREVKEGQVSVFALFDLGSRNGIFVGSKDTYRDDESQIYRHELKDGDYLLLGDTTLVFKQI